MTEGQGSQGEGGAPQGTGAQGTMLTDPGNTGPQGWRESLPADLKTSPSLARYEDVPGLAKAYISLEQRMGVPPERLLKLPADGEDWAPVFSRLGRPENADGYQLPKIEGAGEPNAELDKQFQATAHGLGLTQKQAEGLYQWYGQLTQGTLAEQAKAGEAERAAALQTLQGEWGTAFPEKVELAKRAVAQLGDEKFTEFLNTSKLGDHPALIQVMAKVGELMVQHKLIGGGSTDGFIPSVTNAQQELQRLETDAEFQKALMDREHPNHAAVLARRRQLFEAAYPEQH